MRVDSHIKGRRSTDTERITEIEEKFLKCSADVSESIASLTSRMKLHAETIEKLTVEYKRMNESGLSAMIKEFNDKKVFAERSENYGRRIVFVGKISAAATVIGGTIYAIVYAISNGHWPSGMP